MAHVKLQAETDKAAVFQRLATMLEDAEHEVTKAEEALSQKKAIARDLREKTLPMALDELTADSVSLPDGRRIKVRESITVGPRKEDRGAVIDWLIQAGHAKLVADTLIAEFAKGDVRAELAQSMLKDVDIESRVEQAVHPQTLKAHVRKELEAGRDVPMDLLNVYRMRSAEVLRDEKVFDGE